MTIVIWRWPFENLAKTSFITSILHAHLVAPIIILDWIATTKVVVIATFYRVLTHQLFAASQKYYGDKNKEQRQKSR
jgi:hypothetical protein